MNQYKKTHFVKPARLLFMCLAVVFCAGWLLAQVDPGPRGGPAAAGGPFPSLNADETAFFSNALDSFKEVQSVTGNIPGEDSVGLGPTFNANGCAVCHAQPAIGGSSPGLTSPQNPVPNPQVALATLDGATNTVPPFVRANGPVREARFISTKPDDPFAPLDGGVHGIYTIQGRSDAPGCTLAQPNFAHQLAEHNVIFRIPTPVYGLGLVENTPDAVLEANLTATALARAGMGIRGKFNHSGNDGTITRFGWKAQNKSLLIFAGEAYNVEQGVSNEAFPNERAAVPGCVFNTTPEDKTPTPPSLSDNGNATSDAGMFAVFMRLSAPPIPAPLSPSAVNGMKLFGSVGCALCHSPTLKTAGSSFTGMSNVTYHPFSDFAVHHMGSRLADGVNQGAAGPDEFRSEPLWGLGQRLFFLHDGRTSDLLQAILAHASPGNVCTTSESFQKFTASTGKTFEPFSDSRSCGSEANGVIDEFRELSPSDKQDILNFLRSL